MSTLRGENDHHKAESAFKALGAGRSERRSRGAKPRLSTEHEGSPVMEARHASPEVVVVRTGTANLASINAALERAGLAPRVSSDAAEVADAPLVVLPGVGAFGAAMDSLRRTRLDEAIVARTSLGRPLLAICLGLQLLCTSSEESPGVPGLRLRPRDALAASASLGIPAPWLEHGHARVGVYAGTPGNGVPLLQARRNPDRGCFVHSLDRLHIRTRRRLRRGPSAWTAAGLPVPP